ncbi:helix-turn-helix domain-containing protein [Peribacillus frigoritolerans]|jgi:transcriptional regulator with XRE-family HTH domain|nr:MULTISPECIES: helix-turn-helix domain-containing protein [Peribacillus]KRF50817.1 XRE family transcriptional regulator [Bacillus sp. Soil745]MBD8138312.1 helix-turn-helix transcriptional regulator [Bacillus sp. CFBP 13597]MDP9738408.1 transcriptional regulator with XRE-family HTH domain [Bacillus sp. B2I3]PAW29517.1 XRE family transcriptional regulator [Peribacillus simplex]PHD76592.1 XRE family transcriptional regulator [Bacillus sp. AFS043905]PRS37367.1 tetratricopeptide repeat protein [
MDFFAVGQKIKELRKQIGLSQEELATGICTQAQISKIEKGDVYPYASTLYLISQRLGVDVNYFFDIGMTPRLDYVEEVIYQLKIARRTRNYEEMQQIVKAEENSPLFLQNKKNHQLILWHKGIYEYEKNKDLDKAIDFINQAIAITHTTDKIYSERELEILSSLGVMYVAEEQYENAFALLRKALDHLKALPFLTDKTLKTRLSYNFGRVLTRLVRYEESIACCQDAIKWCLEHDQLYALADLHYHLGYNFELVGNFEEAKEYLEKSAFLFNLQKNHTFVTFINKKLDSWKNEMKVN